MKKKKLKQRIAKLESELKTAKLNEKTWRDMLYRLMVDLKGYGVQTEIIPTEPPVIEVSGTEDMTAWYMLGINTVPLTLSFDFTEHDKTVIYTYL